MKRLITSFTAATLAFSLFGVVVPSTSAADSKSAAADKTADCCSGSKPAGCAAGKCSMSQGKVKTTKILMSPKAMVLAGK